MKRQFKNRIIGHDEIDPEQLLANPRNWRIHPKTQQDALQGVLEEVGWVDDIIVNQQTGFVVDGHLRVALAITNEEETIPIKYVDLTEDEEVLVLATIDPIAAMAATDKDLLADVLESIQTDNEDVLKALDDIAKAEGIHRIVEEDPGADMDRADELQEKWQVERGQVWQIGDHRLACDDSIQLEHDFNHVLFTDPPYGIDYAPMELDEVGSHRQTSRTDGIVGDIGELDLSFLFGFDSRMIWGFPYIYDKDATGWIVWDKQPERASRDIVTPIEIASTTMRKGFDVIRLMWIGYYRAKGEDRHPHPTQKPIGVLEPFIARWTTREDCIYDPFVGSGSTLVACERLKRRCEAVEIEPKYCAVTLERMSQMGLEPELV